MLKFRAHGGASPTDAGNHDGREGKKNGFSHVVLVTKKDSIKLVVLISTICLVFIMVATQEFGSKSNAIMPKLPELEMQDLMEETTTDKFDDEACQYWDEDNGYYDGYYYGSSDTKEEEEGYYSEEDEDGYYYSDDEKRRRLEDDQSKSQTRTDKLTLGRCSYDYQIRVPPDNGYVGGIDWFFFRQQHIKREKCFLWCVDKMGQENMKNRYLVEAASMGLVHVVKKLKEQYGLDPLKPSDFEGRPNMNAIQEAIKGGYADIVKVLTDGNNDLVIDSYGRTVADYVKLKGSPIRPKDAKEILSISSGETWFNLRRTKAENDNEPITTKHHKTGWNTTSTMKIESRCDFDIVQGSLSRQDFYKNYFLPGRPVVLRGFTPEQEIRAFDKDRWETTNRFHPDNQVLVGPTAYPNLSGQERCGDKFTIEDINQAKECNDQPGVPMVHARHPGIEDLKELFPRYNGELYGTHSGWGVVEQFFKSPVGMKGVNLGMQVFLGGDESGATFHWHNAAFNALYVGVKGWRITPPKYRGFTGMQARNAAKLLDESYTLQCTQLPGDFIFIPDFWGHLTLNHGFAIGAAVIMPHHFQVFAGPQNNKKGLQQQQQRPLQGPQQQKVFFVHINKTGGTSMIQMLGKRCDAQYLSGHWNKELHHRSFHSTATSIIARYGRYEWDTAYSFAIVRHPLARQVSNFFFLVGNCWERWRDSCKDRLIPKLNANIMSDEEKIAAFHKYTKKLYKRFPPGTKHHYLFGSRGHGNEEYESFNATQTSWLVDANDKIVVKDIFHLEDLSNNMKKLADAIPCLRGGTQEDVRRVLKELEREEEHDVELIHKNASPKYPDYKLFGKNKETNRIMKRVFAVDYKNFGYKF